MERQQYRSTRSFTKAVESRADELRSGNPNVGQYVVFTSVGKGELVGIDRLCSTRHKGLRSMYLEREELLIVKIMPGPVYEIVCTVFGSALREKTARMGLHYALVDIGGTALQGIESRNESNSAFKPRLSSWPTLVLECGIPKSLNRLRAEARWWLDNSRGEVKTVLLFSISKADREIHLEQWEIPAAPNPQRTRARLPPVGPKKIYELDIPGAIATGAPLRLEFEKLFLRQPVPGEEDIIFTAADLGRLAAIIWSAVQ